MITDWSKPLLDGAMGPGSASQYLLQADQAGGGAVQDQFEDSRLRICRNKQQDILVYGPPQERGADGRAFTGFFRYLRDSMEDTKSEGYREYMMQYMSATLCPTCRGQAAEAGVAGGDDRWRAVRSADFTRCR